MIGSLVFFFFSPASFGDWASGVIGRFVGDSIRGGVASDS